MLVDLNATRVDLVASEHTPYQGANSLALPIREWKSLHGMARAMTSRAGERLRRNATDKQEFEARKIALPRLSPASWQETRMIVLELDLYNYNYVYILMAYLCLTISICIYHLW